MVIPLTSTFEGVDIDTLRFYLVGSYVYEIYKLNTGGIEINGDPDKFYLLLGMIIKDSYPEGFEHILTTLVPYEP